MEKFLKELGHGRVQEQGEDPIREAWEEAHKKSLEKTTEHGFWSSLSPDEQAAYFAVGGILVFLVAVGLVVYLKSRSQDF